MKNFIHIGLPKTGTKFLQRRFFRNLEGVNYCDSKTTHESFAKYLIQADDFRFDVQKAKSLFNEGLKKPKAESCNLFSNEEISGSPWNSAVSAKRNYDRLGKIFDNPHIIMVLRNQKSMLDSLYRHFIKSGGTMSWKKFIDIRNRLTWSFDTLNYARHIQYLMKNFGKENVSVLFYEDFRSNPADYLNQWCGVLGVNESIWDRQLLDYKENVGISPHLMGFMRFMNKFSSSSKHPKLLLPRSAHTKTKRLASYISRILPKKKNLSIPEAGLEDFLLEYYKSNRLLQDLVERDIEGLGYIVR